MDLAKSKATAERLLNKVASVGTVTKKSDVLGVQDQTESVRVKITKRIAEPEQPVKCHALMNATSFPVEGAELLLNGTTYDVVTIEQAGVADEHIVQKVVLHER